MKGEVPPLHNMKACRRSTSWLHSFLTWALDGGKGGHLHALAILPLEKEPTVPVE